MSTNQQISELDGAILSEIEHRGQANAFQVRRAFAESFSLEWKGSAGAVYPAVRRLIRNRLLQAGAPRGGRAARELSLTDSGREALLHWACDAARTANVGVDPFRLRAGIWTLLNKSQRKRLFKEISAQIVLQVQALAACRDSTDVVERKRVELALDMQNARLAFLASWLDQ